MKSASRKFKYSPTVVRPLLRQAWRRFSMLLLLVACAAIISMAMAAEPADSATVHFRVGRWQLVPTLGDNAAQLSRLAADIAACRADSSVFALRSVRVVGGASPEGGIALNERLSRCRAAGIFDYFGLPDSVAVFDYLGRDWSGLRQLVLADTRVPYRRDVLALLDSLTARQPVGDAASDRALAELRAMHGGVPYAYLLDYEFPQLRRSRLYVEYSRSPLPRVVAAPAIPARMGAVCPEYIAIDRQPAPCRPFYMDVRTNLLYDALALPAVGIEFYVGRGWSVGADWMYGWWDNDHRHRYWRAYGGTVNVRRWFGRRAADKPLTGHHVGLYAGVVTYDFEFGGKGQMGGLPHRSLWSRCNYTGGIEYGYTLPVARRLNFDFSIGLGYLGGKYIEYKPEGHHYVWQATRRRNFVGPTKAEISLVWLIGCGNTNYFAKGGRR